MKQNPIKYIYFGSSKFSVLVLDELEKAGMLPVSIVTTPDKPKGRKLILTPTPVKDWGNKRNIKVYDPDKLDAEFTATLKNENADVFIVASYGKIIPREILNIPPSKTLNVHPSLLPKYRGASPLQTSILEDAKNTGITIMVVDEKVDHGGIVAQKEVVVDDWPTYNEFESLMAAVGGKLLAEILPKWVAGEIAAKEQDHAAATFTKKIRKEDGCIDFDKDPYLNFRKIQAYHDWPGAYFFFRHQGRDIRVKITKASFKDGKLKVEKVIPEGAKEMTSEDFYRGYKKS